MSIDQYLDLDLSENGEIAQNLYTRIAKESRQSTIKLTGDGDAGSLSANLTPAMNGWLGSQVSRARQSALAAIEGAAARIKLAGGVEGVVEEIEDDRLRRRKNLRRAQETTAFYDEHRAALDELAELELEYKAERIEHGKRDAKVPSKWADFGIPVIIMIPEFAMNYNSFLKLSGIVAIAVGLSLVVALGIAVSAFVTGQFCKAYHFYMHPDDEVQRQKGYRRIGMASGLFVIAMSAVAYARAYTVLDKVEAAVILGLEPPSVVGQTAGLLAGNLLVFAIGAVITYMIHDEDPDYADKAVAYAEKKEEMESLRARQLTPKLQGIDAGYKEDHKKMLRKTGLMNTQPDYSAISEQMGQIAAKDDEVTGLLKNYRSHLIDEICERKPDFCFSGPSSDRQAGNASAQISPAEFAALPLHLYRSK